MAAPELEKAEAEGAVAAELRVSDATCAHARIAPGQSEAKGEEKLPKVPRYARFHPEGNFLVSKDRS